MVCLLFLVIQIQCKGTEKENISDTQANDIASHQITIKDISQIKYTEYALSDLAKKETNNWISFNLLSTEIENLKKGNYSFFVDDKTILISFIDGLISEVPELLNTASILVRIAVIKTAIYKLEESSTFKNVGKQPILKNIEDLLLAHNHLLLQINKRIEKESRHIEKPR
jgi:hypothetical protein